MNSSEVHIFLIDDEVGVLSALNLVFTKILKYQVTTFSSSKEAIEQLRAQTLPDWIISDLRMPDFDGFDVLAVRNEVCPKIPFILISGHATDEEREKALTLGAVHILKKPFAPNKVSKIIENYQADT